MNRIHCLYTPLRVYIELALFLIFYFFFVPRLHVTFVVSFSLEVLVASVLCYISRRSTGTSRKPSLHVTVIDETGTNRKMKNTLNGFGIPSVFVGMDENYV